MAAVRHRGATLATYAVLALTMADNTTVGVAVPHIRDTFRLGVTSLQWIVAGYVVAFAGLLFTGGWLGDRWGRKRALVAGITTFGAGAVVAAAAVDWRMLLAGRVVQGIGAAASEPGTLSLLRQLHPDEASRMRVLGGWAATSGLALAAGPIAAGLLVAAGGWRAVFVAEAVGAAAAAVAGARRLPGRVERAPVAADRSGQLLVAVLLAALTFGLIDGQDRGFGAAPVVAAWVLAAACAVALVRVERRATEPVLDRALGQDRLVGAGLLAAAAASFALFAVLLLVSLDLEVVDGYSGLATAAFFAPTTVAMVVAGPAGSRWSARSGPVPPLVAGLAGAAAAAAGLAAALSRPVDVAPTVAALAALGFGLGLVVAPVVGTVLTRLPAHRAGAAAAVVTAAREVGGVLGVAVLGATVDGLLFARLTDRLRALGIPLSYRQHVVDAVRGGAPLPRPVVPASGSFVDRYVAALKQTLIDRTVDAGKAAYVDSLRVALLIAVAVLAGAAAGVALLGRHTGADTPTAVGGRC